MIRKYMHQISGPILDRFDIGIEVRQNTRSIFDETDKNIRGDTQTSRKRTSSIMRQAVCRADSVQRERFKDESYTYNSQIPAKDIQKYCTRSTDAQKLIQLAVITDGISMRGYHKLLKTARTIADIDGSAHIQEPHVAKALCYRSLDNSYWAGEEQK